VRLTDFEVLSFGCYGTLIDRDSGIYAALRPLLEAGHVTLGREEVLAVFSRHEAAQQTETPEMLYSEVLAQVHRRLASEWGVLASDDDHALFGTSVSQWPVFVDTPAALQYLKRYFKLVVLSNVDRAGFAASSRRLEVRFDEVLTAEDAGSYKPALANFRRLVSQVGKMGLERHQILHAAENAARDLAPAARCGLATAWIDRASDRAGVDATVEGGPPAAESVRYEFRFASLVDMVRAHQEELRA
jgi:2-haloalkanoic acid dehalogenase type II